MTDWVAGLDQLYRFAVYAAVVVTIVLICILYKRATAGAKVGGLSSDSSRMEGLLLIWVVVMCSHGNSNREKFGWVSDRGLPCI
jgi:hypothetical protein